MAPWGDLLDVTLRGGTTQSAALAAADPAFFAAVALYHARSMLTSRFALLLDPHEAVDAVIVSIFVATCAVTLGEQASAQVEGRSARITMTRTMPAPLTSDGVPAR